MIRVLLLMVTGLCWEPGQMVAKSLVFAPVSRTPEQAMAILRVNCLSCHSDEKKKGGLRLTSLENARKGGESGPAVVPRKLNDSLLAKVILPDSDPHMPPKKQLSQQDIETLRKWIVEGANWDTKALLANPAESKPVRLAALPVSYQPVLALALSPDDKRLAVAQASQILVHDLSQTNRPIVAQLQGHRDAVQSLAWSTNGRLLASGGFRKIVLWDMDTLKQEREITNNLVGRITALQFTSDGATLLAADGVPTKSGIIHSFSVADGKAASFPAHKDTVYALRITHNDKVLATAGADKLIKLWDLSTQKELGKLEAHLGHVLALAFNHEGTMLASGSADRVLHIWDIKTHKHEITLNKHPLPITGLAWTPDGKSLFSICEDGAPRLFTDFKFHSGAESSDGARDQVFNSAGEMLYSLAVTADGKTIFAGSDDGAVYVWNRNGKLAGKLPMPDPGKRSPGVESSRSVSPNFLQNPLYIYLVHR